MNEKQLRMPYGKYRGKLISELPSKYLLWVAENWKENSDINKLICKQADDEYQFRKKHNTHRFYEE